MAKHVTGIAITIRAFIPTGKTLDEQHATLTLVKNAHESGDYTAVLKAANIDEVKAEQKTRRVEDKPAEAAPTIQSSGEPPADQNGENVLEGIGSDMDAAHDWQAVEDNGGSDADAEATTAEETTSRRRRSAA